MIKFHFNSNDISVAILIIMPYYNCYSYLYTIHSAIFVKVGSRWRGEILILFCLTVVKARLGLRTMMGQLRA